MTFKQLSARGLVAVLAAGLLVAGCTPEPDTQPTASPGTGSTQASPSATPTPTRTESAEEQKQREAFEAAEKAYRINFEEVGRLGMKGGVDQPTAALKATSTGTYLDLQMQSLRYLVDQDAKVSQNGEIGWVRDGAYSDSELVLMTCEDFSKVALIDSAGKTVAPEGNGSRVAHQTIKVKWTGKAWKLADIDSTQVSKC